MQESFIPSMSNLKVTVWNVEHGASIYLVAPNGKKVIFDCGSSDDFSPANHINSSDEKKTLNFLVISHPHQDHITDLANIEKRFDTKLLRRNKKIDKEIMKKDNPDVFCSSNAEYINKYFEFVGGFSGNTEWKNNPRNPSWGNGCTVHTFSNDDMELEVNDLSVVTFIDFANQTILYGGDLKEKGWIELLKDSSFKKHLSKTTIFIASHHGNDSGYCAELFDHFTPKITIFSAGDYQDQAISKYEYQTEGMTVQKRSGGEEDRLVLTTRNDGHIEMVLYPDSSMTPKIKID